MFRCGRVQFYHLILPQLPPSILNSAVGSPGKIPPHDSPATTLGEKKRKKKKYLRPNASERENPYTRTLLFFFPLFFLCGMGMNDVTTHIGITDQLWRSSGGPQWAYKPEPELPHMGSGFFIFFWLFRGPMEVGWGGVNE